MTNTVPNFVVPNFVVPNFVVPNFVVPKWVICSQAPTGDMAMPREKVQRLDGCAAEGASHPR